VGCCANVEVNTADEPTVVGQWFSFGAVPEVFEIAHNGA
jgi:hypothetical protein